jgi:hypothetical protein
MVKLDNFPVFSGKNQLLQKNIHKIMQLTMFPICPSNYYFFLKNVILPGQSAGPVCRASLPGRSAGPVCRASLPGQSAGPVCRASLPGQSAGPVCRASLPGQSAGQVCWASLPGMSDQIS